MGVVPFAIEVFFISLVVIWRKNNETMVSDVKG